VYMVVGGDVDGHAVCVDRRPNVLSAPNARRLLSRLA